jgi:hypothetical protein
MGVIEMSRRPLSREETLNRIESFRGTGPFNTSDLAYECGLNTREITGLLKGFPGARLHKKDSNPGMRRTSWIVEGSVLA